MENGKKKNLLDVTKNFKPENKENKKQNATFKRNFKIFNVASQFYQFQRDVKQDVDWYLSAERIVVKKLKNYSVFQIIQLFDRRVTTLSWHPSKKFLVSGSKGGDMCLLHVKGSEVVNTSFWKGNGPGHSILSCHFPKNLRNKMLVACMDGTIRVWNFADPGFSPVKTLMNTCLFEEWFCSVNSSPTSGLIVVGGSNGVVSLLDKNYKTVSKLKVHKNKINTIDFNKRDGNLFVTASVDHTVKLFDVRNLKTALGILNHKKAVNSAFFSPKSNVRVLTTDQDSEINVYKGPSWNLETSLVHPHRQFQHLTPIRASWHPLCDLIVVGRYPDPKLPGYSTKELRTLDIFSAQTGQLKAQLFSISCSGISSLINFDDSGEYIAAGMGRSITFWRSTDPIKKRLLEDLPDDDERESFEDTSLIIKSKTRVKKKQRSKEV